MKKYFRLIVALLVIPVIQVSGQVKVTHVETGADKPDGKGVFYILPRTVVQVDVTVSTQKHLKGPLSEYAEEFFGIDDAVKYDYTTYEMEDVQIGTFTEPDPGQIYFIEPRGTSSKEMKTLTVQLNRAGFLLSANNMDQELSQEKETETVEEFIGADGKVKSPAFFIDGKVRTKVDTIIRRAVVDTIVTEQVFYRSRIIQKTGKELAVEMLNKLGKIREDRYKLLTGYQETAYPAEAVEYMDKQLKTLENEIMALFRGKVFTTYNSYTFYYTPAVDELSKAHTLFNFSNSTGLTEAGSSTGEKVMIKATGQGLAEVLGKFPGSDAKEDEQSGIFYRIPATCRITVDWDGEILADERVTVNQAGVVRNLQDRNFKADFYPETGGVKSVIIK